MAVPLSAGTAQTIIDNYVSPAWFAAQKVGDQTSMTHFHNLADNLRIAAGIPLQVGKAALPFQRLPKSNVQEIIFRWLSPAWYKAKAANDKTDMAYYNKLANALRVATGMPTE
ncbi:hypothetical protein [Paenibacillus apii]|uniref:hypothetical protein n=1 Tax=Paenibacillus apii TaxID=1850370 RepID=UPI001F24A5EC|nr:hypothetical protein [Paenibacillus apii]